LFSVVYNVLMASLRMCGDTMSINPEKDILYFIAVFNKQVEVIDEDEPEEEEEEETEEAGT